VHRTDLPIIQQVMVAFKIAIKKGVTTLMVSQPKRLWDAAWP
jgi:hypothetical protein